MKIEGDTLQMIRAWRIACVGLLFVIGVGLLLWRLWNVQVKSNQSYNGAQVQQMFRRVQMPSVRGRILDRQGVVLAESRPSYQVVLYCEELRRPGRWENTIEAVDQCIDGLSRRLDLPREVTRKDVQRHILQRLPMPFIVFKDVDFRVIAQIEEWRDALPGVDILTTSQRVYPQGALAAHVIGSVRTRNFDRQEGEKWNFRLPELQGRSGIEARYDEVLTGVSGEAVLRVDSRGYAFERWVKQEEQPGHDITLTLDVKLQQVAEAALAQRPGALVALDPRNGDVLVLASTPGYDLNLLVPPVAKKDYASLIEDVRNPLFNRAIQGSYPPGSVFKPFTAIAAQEHNYNADTLYYCSGVYTDYKLHLRCASRWGHGELDMRQALEKSCNPYFCHLGTSIGIEAIAATAEQAGFGMVTGIDLPGEIKGLMPTPEWKKRVHAAAWTPSDTAQCAIGQGAITVTPLQVAHAIGTLAVGGAMYRPRLVATGNTEGELQRKLEWSRDAVKAVIEGMCMVVASGTGRTMQVEGVTVAGKTGTAEYNDAATHSRKKRVWCTAFAPAENPEIVVAAMLENGDGGGKDVGPIIQKVLSAYFNANAVKLSTTEVLDED